MREGKMRAQQNTEEEKRCKGQKRVKKKVRTEG